MGGPGCVEEAGRSHGPYGRWGYCPPGYWLPNGGLSPYISESKSVVRLVGPDAHPICSAKVSTLPTMMSVLGCMVCIMASRTPSIKHAICRCSVTATVGINLGESQVGGQRLKLGIRSSNSHVDEVDEVNAVHRSFPTSVFRPPALQYQLPPRQSGLAHGFICGFHHPALGERR